MTIQARFYGRCETCGCVQPVSDWHQPHYHESAGRWFLIHAEFNIRCSGSEKRAYGWWRGGEEPPPIPTEGGEV